MANFWRVFVALVLAVSVRDWIGTAEAQESGVCYGILGDNLPSPDQVVAMYNQYNISSMRIFDPNPDVMQALHLAGEKLAVHVGVKNEDLPGLAASVDAAAQWISTNIDPYPNFSVNYIVVGNEVIPGDLAQYVVPAMQNLHTALNSSTHSGVGVTTAIPMQVLAASYPPSSGAFSDETSATMTGIINFLVSISRPIMLNVYPYFAYASDPEHVRLDYAQFTATEPVVQDQGLDYYNLFDAMIDAFHAAAEKVGVANVDVIISESGWPSAGNGNMTTVELAQTYNTNLWKRLHSGAGTPRRPSKQFSGFIFAMFNEDLKPAGVEQNWGLFYPGRLACISDLFMIDESPYDKHVLVTNQTT